jgi:hypothetical protein
MDRRQKERLRFLLKARKRADKVLAERREVVLKKQERKQRLEANQELMKQYTQELTVLAQESGILTLAEQAAARCGGSLAQEVSYFVYYGLSSSSFQNALGVADQGELRASHLALRINWQRDSVLNEAEILVHKNGQITFHNCLLPIFPFVWRSYPHLLETMLASAMNHPRPPAPLAKKGH